MWNGCTPIFGNAQIESCSNSIEVNFRSCPQSSWTQNPIFLTFGPKILNKNFQAKAQSINTVDGWNPAPVEVGSLSHYLQGFCHIPRGWEWDFWTINRMARLRLSPQPFRRRKNQPSRRSNDGGNYGNWEAVDPYNLGCSCWNDELMWVYLCLSPTPSKCSFKSSNVAFVDQWHVVMEHQVFPPLQPEAGCVLCFQMHWRNLPSDGPNCRFPKNDFKDPLKLDVNHPIWSQPKRTFIRYINNWMNQSLWLLHQLST